jgi:hypothetical protein
MKQAVLVAGLAAFCLHTVAQAQQTPPPLSVTPNVNMMSGVTNQHLGDKFLQRQGEPVIGVSTLNPDHLFAAGNDYRSVDIALDTGTGESGQQGESSWARLWRKIPIFAGNRKPRAKVPPDGAAAAEAWMGVYFSYDRGKHWTTGLVPGFPQDTSAAGLNSPIYGFEAATDPALAVMTAGRFALAGVAFTRGGQSAMFVSHWRDVSTVEGKHSIKSEGTHIVVQLGSASSNGVFTDKPAIISDVNRTSPDPQACGPLYLAFSIFDGVTSQGNFRTKLMFSRSIDCGNTWLNPFKINANFNRNQGLALAVDPNSGHLYATWRALEPNGIMMVKSTDGGLNFSSPVVISGATAIAAFDQPTAGSPSYSFRSNAFPTFVADADGRLHAAWQARRVVNGVANGAPLVFGTMSSDGGNTWSTPHPLQPEWSDTPPIGSAWALDGVPPGVTRIAGPQVMPNYVFSRGRLMLLYYEAYGDISPTFISGITREIAARVVQLNPADESVISSAFMTRYTLNAATHDVASVPGSTPPARAVNRPNLTMYKAGCCPFIGDYITLASSATFIRNPAAAIPTWVWGTQPTDAPSATFHAVWTDNRDVVFPGGNINGDWTAYSPPGTGAVSCVNAGSRNANIYTAELGSRLIAGSPRTSKALAGTTRAFVAYAQNRSAFQRFFRFSLPPAAPASFSQDALVKTRDVAVVPFGSVTQTVYVTAMENQSVLVSIAEITGIGGSPVSGGDTATVLLNPDPNNPELNNPELNNPELHNPELNNPELNNPELNNPELNNPELNNPELNNPELNNPVLGDPQVTDSGSGSGRNLKITDVTFATTTTASTVSGYQGMTNVTNAAALLAAGHRTKLFVYRTYQVPTCRTLPDGSSTVVEVPIDQLISVVTNPTLNDPNQPLENTTALQLATNSADPTFPSSTFYVGPPPPPGAVPDGYRAETGPDRVKVTLRIYHDHGPEVVEAFNPLFVSHGVTAHARNVINGVPEAKAKAKFWAPDLVVTNPFLNATPTTVYTGETVSIPAVPFVNQGNAATNSARLAFSARAYLTTHNDPIVKAQDIPLGISQQFGVIEPGNGSTFPSVTVTIPPTTKASALIAPGAYFLRVVIDDGNNLVSKNAEVVESEEANNFATMPIIILPGADLKLAANPTISLPNKIAPGETFGVGAFTVVNQGTANSLTSFRNRFELFPGAQTCPPAAGAPTVITELNNSEVLAGAQTAWGPSIIPVPRTTPAGTYTLRLGVDGSPTAFPWNDVFERDEITFAGSGLNNQACYTLVVTGLPAPEVMTFVQQPATATVGVVMAPVAVTVTLGGAPVTNGQVSVKVSSGPLRGTLSGTLKVSLNNSGIASFTDLRLSVPGTYVLVATMPGASAALSASIVVVQ